MSQEVGIVMSLYDKVSPTLKGIGQSTKAFDKNLQELEQACAAYEKSQERLNKDISALKSGLAQSNEKVREATKAWKAGKDEISKGMLDRAIEEQTAYKAKLKDTEAALNSQRKAVVNLASEARKAETSQGNSSTGLGGLGKGLVIAGVGKLASDAVGQFASAFLSSAIGEPQARLASSALSGAISGGTMGAMLGLWGIAAGAAIGGLSGLVSGGAEIFKAKDDTFQGYVQEQTEGQLTQRAADIQGGSAVAAQREQDDIAFNTLLGGRKGTAYLTKLRELAAATPMEYGDLTTMSRSLATGFKDDPNRMLSLMTSIGNAGSAVGVDAAGMNVMATGMARMQASGKVTLEYINLIQERGVDAIGMLADGLGTSKAEIYDMISKGKIEGVNAVNIIQEAMDTMYKGAMAKQSKTFGGLSSTLADAQTEMQSAYGEGYNEERGKGIQEQIDWLGGESGKAQQEANKAMGAYYASLENAKEKYIRDAVDSAMGTEEYQQAKAAGDAAAMGRIIAEAKVQGQNEYNANEGKAELEKSEFELARNIRNNTQTNEAFYDAGYRKGKEYSKGIVSAMLVNDGFEAGAGSDWAALRYQRANGYAYGLGRVPYDGYPAILHQGERVLTASQARQQDNGGGGGVNVTVNGLTVREEADVKRIAKELAWEIARAKTLASA